MNPRSLEVTGAWFQAGGNIISAIGNTRAFIGEENVEDPLVIVGESLQALGNVLQAVAPEHSTNSKEDEKEETEQIDESAHKNENKIVKNKQPGDVKDQGENNVNQVKKKGKSLEKTGAEVQALGNISDIIGTVLNMEKEEKENDYLIIAGNSLQSLGAFLEVVDELRDVPDIQWLEVIGNSIQTLGAGLQAFQGLYNVLKEEKKESDNEKEDDNSQKNGEGKKETKVDEQLLGLIGNWIQVIGAVIEAIGETIEPQS
ncbi:DUF6944 family repetitive protein [Bacillus gaemokensis]|uniref:AraC family transcriptional regulator n=1 Tax=Bacillus gaemokensis TaxID=574375 RepID=A0A073KEC3_9BACI|nr:hypothetical protein [Bacillus gaemokensis]KEK25609.1 AraC family transcriptional regulator [Bacillus gaemokensis]KYG36949.1 AraC family transcriptional regulator [Bacillus gaemokensis]